MPTQPRFGEPTANDLTPCPTRSTLVFDGLGLACTDLPPDPALDAPFLFAIEHGQIQVHP